MATVSPSSDNGTASAADAARGGVNGRLPQSPVQMAANVAAMPDAQGRPAEQQPTYVLEPIAFGEPAAAVTAGTTAAPARGAKAAKVAKEKSGFVKFFSHPVTTGALGVLGGVLIATAASGPSAPPEMPAPPPPPAPPQRNAPQRGRR